MTHRGKDIETIPQEPLQSPRLSGGLDDDQTFRHSNLFIPISGFFFRRRGSGRRILRSFLVPAQCPNVAVLMTAHSAVELESREPAKHFGDRNLKFPSDLGSVQSQNVRKVRKDSVASRREADAQALRRLERVVEHLLLNA